MKNIFGQLSKLLILVVILQSCGKEEFDNLKNAKSYSLNSVNTNSIYDIKVLYPPKYDENKSYHLVYLLDGNWFFNELAKFISDQYTNEIILIGIGYESVNNRMKDYSYPAHQLVSNSGGGLKFNRFLQEELLPFISDDLFIEAYETTLCGHSLAGYFALFQLFQKESSPFDNVIAASPSLYWSDAYILDLEDQYSAVSDTLDLNLITTMGSIEGVTMNTMFDVFNDRIESRNFHELAFTSTRYPKTSHNNNPIRSFSNGLDKILN